jgi:peroxiredoxin
MGKEKLTWRSFSDQGAINERWNAGTPTYYVIDPKGVIRYKWFGYPGAKALDTALETLIQGAEGDGKHLPK